MKSNVGFRVATLMVLAGAVIVAFQNCSQPAPAPTEDQLASEASKVEFAYESSVDQITHMSCNGAEVGTFDTGAYFSYRAGAYRNGGIRLTDSFRTNQSRKPAEKQATLLWASPLNSGTTLQLSVRERANYQSIYKSTSSVQKGQDYSNIFEPLGSPDLSSVLVSASPATKIRYLRNGTVFGSRFEGSLFFAPQVSGSIRQALKNDAFITLTYSHAPPSASSSSSSAGEFLARSPSDFGDATSSASSRAFGRGYKLAFAQPALGTTPPNANFPAVVLREVVEESLMGSADRSVTGTWVCPETMRFRIVRPEDVKATLVTCSMAADPATLPADLAIVRNHIRSEDWYVDMVNRCIVPKKSPSTCYGTVVKTVQYNISQTCTEGADPACVHYASVCYRN